MRTFFNCSILLVTLVFFSRCSNELSLSKKDTNSLKINFVSLNGIVEEGLEQYVSYRGKVKEPGVVPTLDNRTFEGWYSDTSFTKKFDFNKEIEHDTNIYMKWRILNLVQFETNGGGVIPNQRVINGNVAKIPDTPKYKGHEFLGWFSDSDLKKPFRFTSRIKSNITLYVKWKSVYTISFVNTGGEEISSITVYRNQKLESLPQPQPRDGLFLKGWFLQPTFDTVFNPNTQIISDVTLYAMWVSVWVSIFKVSYDSNGGSEVNFQRVLRDRRITLPQNPKRNGYEFLGWSTTKSGEQPLFDFSQKISEDTILYAKWKFVG